MNNIDEVQNINSYYSDVAKIKPQQRIVVNAPDNIPQYQLFNDTVANEKLSNLEADIYVKKENATPPTKKKKKFGIF
ncbi:MAG: hypothetical protein MJ237_06420 [bacterium]|nr:hypothetical protein [bacterium]